MATLRGSQPECPPIWTASDIAAYLGVEKKTALNSYMTHPKFPRPIGGAKRCRRYFADEVIRHFRNSCVSPGG